MKNFLKETKAQAMVESAIVLPIFLTVIFAIIQMGLVFNAKFILNYAAYSAARIGIVHSSAEREAKMWEGMYIACVPLETVTNSTDNLVTAADNFKDTIKDNLKMTIVYPNDTLLYVHLEYDYQLIIPFGNVVIYTIMNFKPDYKIAEEEMVQSDYRIRLQSDYRMRIQS
ncbi:MAG: pilus assembly protein [Candidatus Aureabacteria bacterium]|nr:pilus assembly protein [Candidatus Auribacterota bacterium]